MEQWIKQLGFSFYVFPGAEHSRFGHSIGAMYNAQKILESCNIAVSDMDLMNSDIRTPDAIFHKSLRLAALMHDLGTFCFSHTTEAAFKEPKQHCFFVQIKYTKSPPPYG